jgi:S1-C subfamily serine protease
MRYFLAAALFLLLSGCSLFKIQKPTTTQEDPPGAEEANILQGVVDSTVEIGDGVETYCTGVAVEGTILTANHCVEEGKDFGIKYQGTWYVGALIKRDAENDLAVVAAVGARMLTWVRMSPEAPMLGQRVVWLGFPLGGHMQLGVGIVSYADDGKYFDVQGHWLPGNSGGPVFDEHGELLGIVNSTSALPGDPIPQFLDTGHAIHWRWVRDLINSL